MSDSGHPERWDENTLLATRHSLLNRLKDWSDDKSWREFFEAYWRLIYGVARRCGLGDADAQDVVQEVAMKVGECLRDGAFQIGQGKGSFKAWLRTVTRRRVVDEQRQARRRPIPTEAQVLPDIAAGGEFAGLWDRQWVEAAAARVKLRVRPEQFQIFDLYVLQDRSVAEVMRRLGVSLAKVYLAKHKVAPIFKKVLAELDTPPDGESDSNG